MQTEVNMDERRTDQRVPYGAWAEDLTHSGDLSFYLTRNVSRGGLLLVNPAGGLPPVGNRLRLRLVVENEERVFTVNGQVVRHGRDVATGTDLFAVRFHGLDPLCEQFLQQLVAERPGSKAS